MTASLLYKWMYFHVQWTFSIILQSEIVFIAPLCILIESIDSIENVERNFVYKNYCCLIGIVKNVSNKSLDFNSLQNFSLFIPSRTIVRKSGEKKTRINAEKALKAITAYWKQ